jgi:3-hydroxyisobutyrate dehydrogenase
MLADWDAVESAMTGPDGALNGMSENAIWVQMSTIGVAATERAAELAEETGVTLVDAPVSGTKEPAEKGELIVIVAGPERALDTCEPVFAAIGQKTVRVGAEPGRASAFKLVLNTWLIGLVQSLAETIALARALGFEPELFLETISGGALDSQYAQLKGKAMAQEEFPASFPLRLARKDAGLVVQEAERRELDLPAIRAALRQLERASELGLGDQDLAAVYEAARPGVERPA